MLERKFYLETDRLQKLVRAREKPCSSRKDAEHAEKTNNRVKDKTIIRRSFVVKDVSTVIPAHPGSGPGQGPESSMHRHSGVGRNPVE